MSDDYYSGYYNPGQSHAAGSDAYAGAKQREKDETFNSFYRQPWTIGTHTGPATLTPNTSNTSAEIGNALGALYSSMDGASATEITIGVVKFAVGAGIAYIAYSLHRLDWVTGGMALGALYLLCDGFPAVLKLFGELFKIAFCLGAVVGLLYVFLEVRTKTGPVSAGSNTVAAASVSGSQQKPALDNVPGGQTSPAYATVATKNLKLRSCPFENDSCKLVTTMPEGLRVRILSSARSGWYEVEAPGDGTTSYRGFAYGGKLLF